MKNNILDSLQDDYNYCITNPEAFISCKTFLEEILNEAYWDRREIYSHYGKHVCGKDEEYTGYEDETGRIKFPNMPIGKYLSNAEKLADAYPFKGIQNDTVAFGWKSRFGWLGGDVSLKFKKSND